MNRSEYQLRVDPLPALMASGDQALVWRVRRELRGEQGDAQSLWELPAVTKVLRRQQPDGSWRYGGNARRTDTAYDQLATYEVLLELVAKFSLDVRHPAIASAADFLLSFQAEDGDVRGMYGNQHSPNYTAAILAVLLDAGYPHENPRIERAMQWLLGTRQQDGGWAIPFRTHSGPDTTSYNAVMRLPEPVEPDRAKPFSHLVTGIVLRAFAAHPHYRHCPEAAHAGALLGSRFFKPDRYPDRCAAAYWEKLRYPFRWTDIVSALDAMQLVGITTDDPAVSSALTWLADRQQTNGLWHSPYDKAADPHVHHWTSFAAARLFHRADSTR